MNILERGREEEEAGETKGEERNKQEMKRSNETEKGK